MHVDHVERVDARAEALRHPPPVRSLDHGRDVDVVEGDVTGELEPAHDHPRDPEVDDVARRDEQVGRVEGAQLRRVLGPAEGRKRPQRRGEPRVEHVLVAAQGTATAAARLGADVGLGDERLLARVAVPDGELMAPPELARDAPRPDAGHPVEVDALPALGHDPHLVALDDGDRGLGELAHRTEPLQRDQRLDALARAMGERHRVAVGLLAAKQSGRPQLGDNGRLGLGRGEPDERSAAGSIIRPSGPITEISSSPWARPISKSLGSCPGVILSAPVPKSMSTYSSAMIGSSRPTSGSSHSRADQVRVALILGVHGDGRCRRASSPAARWRR